MNKISFGKQLVAFVGAMGSGKTEVALNYAALRSETEHRPVYLADLDVRKPYFRSRDLVAGMRARGVRVISTPEALSGLDFPGFSAEMESIFRRKEPAVIDSGGDPDGARILGRFREHLEERGAEVLFVINRGRMESRGVAETADALREIAAVSRVRISGLVNNTHLMWESSIELIKEGEELVRNLSEKLGLPIAFHSMLRRLAFEAENLFPEPVLPMDVMIGPEWFPEMYQEVKDAHR
jgi:hypothetical protein